MDIAFRIRSLVRMFNSRDELAKAHGDRLAKKIMMRLETLRTAQTLAMVPATPPVRRHQLSGKRKEQYAVDLDRNRRLVFKPAHEPIPYNDDGGIDLGRVTAITILEVVDYH